MFDLDIKGARSLNRKLNRLRTTVSRKAVRPALHTALVPVVQTARAYAPVRTGRLQSSIKSFVRSSRRYGLTAGVRTGTRKQLRIPPEAEYYYPAAIELGSRRNPPRSFLRAAMNARRKTALQILGKEVHKALKKL